MFVGSRGLSGGVYMKQPNITRAFEKQKAQEASMYMFKTLVLAKNTSNHKKKCFYDVFN